VELGWRWGATSIQESLQAGEQLITEIPVINENSAGIPGWRWGATSIQEYLQAGEQLITTIPIIYENNVGIPGWRWGATSIQESLQAGEQLVTTIPVINEKYAGIFILLKSPGIDSKESIPTAYKAWPAGTITGS